MELDLRKNGQLSIEHAKLITYLEPNVRLEYNAYIGELAKVNNVAGLTWLTQVTCRNTLLSLIHDRFCRLRLLETILDRGDKLDTIVLDNDCMRKAVVRLCQTKGSNASVTLTGNERIRRGHVLLNIFKSLYLLLNLFIWPKLIRGKGIPRGPIIYLDNFLFIDSFDGNNNLKDRYYPGFINHLPNEATKQRTWYVPTLYGIKTPKQFLSLFRSIRKSSQQFIMKEDWLKLSDYFNAFIFSFILPKKIKTIPNWKGLDISELVKQEIQVEMGSASLMSTVLIYHFIRRLAKVGVELDVVIDWHENQVIDRALNLAVKKYYPNIRVKGYQGYAVPDYYACKDPTDYEQEAGTLPDEICVIGDVFIEAKKKYCTDLKVTKAPAFRFSRIHDSRYSHCEETNEILMILPISLDEGLDIIQLCKEAASVLGNNYIFFIKQHPSYTKQRFLRLVPESKSSCFRFADKDLYEHLYGAKLLVSAWSSVCLEAAVMGVPVAIAGNRSGPAMNPLSGIFDNDHKRWKLVYSGNDIQSLLMSDPPEKIHNREFYFSQIGKDEIEERGSLYP